MEQIYTIPVNEAFDAARETPALGCPICALYHRLEENELDLILGASMMEPDIRIRTNAEGFCHDHFTKMAGRRNRLSGNQLRGQGRCRREVSAGRRP